MKNIRTELYYAFMISLFMLIWITFEKVSGLHDEFVNWYPYITPFVFTIPLIGYWLAINRVKFGSKGGFSFRNAFNSGLIITIFVAFLKIPSIYFFYKIVNPDFTTAMMEVARKEATINGEDVDKAMQSAETYYGMKSYILQSFFGFIIFGIITSVILGFIISRRK